VRGVRQLGGAATTGVYLDAIPLTSNSPFGTETQGGFAFDGMLGDIERVEFLKGPQGTLYGATSVGGAVKYITRKPSLDEFRGHASVDYSSTKEGGFNQIYNGRISMPLVEDKLGLTVAGFYEDNGGLVDLVDATGTLIEEDGDQYDRYGFSGDLYYKFSDRFDFRARVLYQKADYNNVSQVNIDPDTKEPDHRAFAGAGFTFKRGFRNSFYTGTFEYQFEGATLTATSSYVEEDRSTRVNSTAPNILSIMDTRFGRDPGTTTLFTSNADIGSQKFTQEIQLTSESSETWEWIVGLYYADEETFFTNTSTVQPDDLIHLSTEGPSFYKEYAAFGNLTYYVTPEFDLTVGGRLSRNEMTLRSETASDAILLQGLVGSSDATPVKDTVDTWSFAARYRPTEELSLYTRIASGYRPASANKLGTPEIPSFAESDSLWSYELGAKGSLAEGLFSYDIAVWYFNWNNFQAKIVREDTVTGLLNASGGITGKGVEGSFTFKPLNGLSIISNFAYTDSTLNEDEAGLDGEKGQQLPYVPKWTFSSRANYAFALTSELDAMIGAGVRYEGSSRSAFTDKDGGSRLNIPTDSYVVVDVNAGVTWDQISLNLYATNLLNEEAMVNTEGVQTFSVTATGVPLKPRTIGIRLSVDF